MDRLPLPNRLDNRLLKLAAAYHYPADYLSNSIENTEVRKRHAELMSVQTANGRDRVYGSEKVYASLQMGFMNLCMSARSPAQVRAMGDSLVESLKLRLSDFHE
jgi:hypothetical protein